MNDDILYAPHAGRSLRAGLAGAGEFGASFLFRSGRAPGLRVEAVADPDTARAVRAARAAGFAPQRIRVCATRGEAREAQARGDFVVLADGVLLAQLELDFVVEATGDPESAARHALAAIEAGRNVAMVTKEADSVIGAELQARAAAAGVVCTPVDGDQPSLMIALVTRARALGLEVVCAGKSGEFDLVFDAGAATVTSTAGGAPLADAEFASLWSAPPGRLAATVAARAQRLAAFGRATPPDLCELTLVANATGLRPDRAALHAPIARTLELPELLRPGGLLGGGGRLDMFVCLRRPDELSFAGGVFVVVRCDDAAAWSVLREKGIPVSADGGFALLHNPVHLLGLEAPASLMAAGFLRLPAAAYLPRCELVARAGAGMPAGAPIAPGARHALEGFAPEIAEAVPPDDAAPLPYYLAAGCTLRRAVAAGALLARGDIEPPEDSVLWRLRAAQDARFFPA